MKNKSIKLDKCTSLSDVIDDYCRSKYGHSNWAWYDSLEMAEDVGEKGDLEGVIIFYFEDLEEKDDE